MSKCLGVSLPKMFAIFSLHVRFSVLVALSLSIRFCVVVVLVFFQKTQLRANRTHAPTFVGLVPFSFVSPPRLVYHPFWPCAPF